jgi:hypothetical protein
MEFWLARKLQDLLENIEWRNFLKIIEKARESCKTPNHTIPDHFVDVNKSIPVPKDSAECVGNFPIQYHGCRTYPPVNYFHAMVPPFKGRTSGTEYTHYEQKSPSGTGYRFKNPLLPRRRREEPHRGPAR